MIAPGRAGQLLEAVGKLLYGPDTNWREPLADALGVDIRTLRRWAAGQAEPVLGVWKDIAELLRANIEAEIEILRQVQQRTRVHGAVVDSHELRRLARLREAFVVEDKDGDTKTNSDRD